eukprot:3137521-Rhodomonas_salina.1
MARPAVNDAFAKHDMIRNNAGWPGGEELVYELTLQLDGLNDSEWRMLLDLAAFSGDISPDL